MEFKPNEVTAADAKAVVQKFKEYNKGVVVGNSKYLTSHNWDDVSAKWPDLMNETKYSINSIRQKMLDVYREMKSLPEDEILGDVSTAFTHTTERNKKIKFTYADMYIFLREALRERKETSEYKKNKKKLDEANKYLDENKSQDVKMKEMQELKAKLEVLVGESIDSGNNTIASAPTATATQS